MAEKLPLIEGSGVGPSWLGTSQVSRCGVLTKRALSSLSKRRHLHSQPLARNAGFLPHLVLLLHPPPSVLGSIH